MNKVEKVPANVMDVKTINHLLAEGNIDRDDMWPRIIEVESKAHQFRFEFGLNELPRKYGAAAS